MPPQQVKGMWDSVVSWMKMAVEFITVDGAAEPDPSATPPPNKVSCTLYSRYYIEGQDFATVQLLHPRKLGGLDSQMFRTTAVYLVV